MKKINLYILIFALTTLLGCKKDNAIEGPELVDIFGVFEVQTPLKGSVKQVDFSKGEQVLYTIKLSVRTPWTIEVIGLNSGAKKVFTGNEKDLINNPVVWDGTISFAPFFRKMNLVLQE